MELQSRSGRWLRYGCLVAVVLLVANRPLLGEPLLSPRNLEAPFPYRAGETRTWPILEGAWRPGTEMLLVVREGDTVLNARQLQTLGLNVMISPGRRLTVVARADARATLHVEVMLTAPDGVQEKQVLQVRPAPPDRPISYYADFGDDLIRIFMNSTTGNFSPVTKSGFDQYFRRLQAHGTRRLIVWLSPFPYIANPINYSPDVWQRYVQQARAILDDPTLSQTLQARTGFVSWKWLRYLLAARLNPDFGRLLGQSAAEHGIHLTVSFRPFESALTKYYEVPAFDVDGTYLWGFLPFASPTVNYHPEELGWRHYRDVVRGIGLADTAELAEIILSGVTQPERFLGQPGIELLASPYPPLATDGLVLVRQPSGSFRLQPFETIRESASARLVRIGGVRVEASALGLHLKGDLLPRGCRYLVVSWTGQGDGPDLSALSPVMLHAKAGNRLGRETTYWVQGGPTDPSRVAGITADGEFRAEFQACEASQRAVAAGPERVSLAGRQLVIDFGSEATAELIDFNQPFARANAVRELATVLQHPGFDEILINTRSHVDLPVSLADGDEGVRPIGWYWRERRGPRVHLGLDKAYLPRSPRSLERIVELTRQPGGIEQVTTWQPQEWRDTCQSANGHPWRYARNVGVADGVRRLLEDLERAFPGRRIRMLVPPREVAVQEIRAKLDTLLRPDGTPYGRDYYHQLWPTNNHIPAAGEGAALVDLRGLTVEPSFLGSGGTLVDKQPFELFVNACLADMADNRGSRYRGPRSYFFEAQTTLRATDLASARQVREEMIRYLLAQAMEVNEVILYEAADWLYFFPLSDIELCSHRFLDRAK